jgi:hypothetical protein
MSEFTFDIADYRLRTQRVQEIGAVAKSPSGFVLLTSNAREREDSWMEATRPAVVEIRSIREPHRTSHASCHAGAYPRRKILRFTNFTNDVPRHVITMALPDSAPRSDDDPDPTDFPTAA